MTESRISVYADALVLIARAEEATAEVEDELFRFARVVEGNEELKATLADPHIPAARRQQIVEDILGGSASPATLSIVSMIVANGRARDLGMIVDEFVHRAADTRGEVVAEVRSAVALSDDQVQRLATALSAKTDREVSVRNIVDPTVVGGLVTTIGDTVLDGSVRTRLNQLRDVF